MWIVYEKFFGLSAKRYYFRQFFLARESLGLPKNIKQAIQLLEKADKQGYTAAQLKLSILYLQEEERCNECKAVELLKRIVSNTKHPRAQYYLGICFAKGKGTNKDLGRAQYFLAQAAKQGFKLAQEALDKFKLKKSITRTTFFDDRTPAEQKDNSSSCYVTEQLHRIGFI